MAAPLGRWRPILRGETARQALDAVSAIADALDGPDVQWARGAPPPDAGDRPPSLAGGTAGLAVFFAYLHENGIGTGSDERAIEMLDAAGACVASAVMDASLHGGFTGVAWATAHLVGRVLDESDDGEDPLGEIDAALLAHLARRPWDDDYDLISGLAGFAVYWLERLPRSDAVEGLARVVARLAETAVAADGGITWHTRPGLLPEWQREICPLGYRNVGLAHGVPGVIAVLGRIAGGGLGGTKAHELLDGAVAWLLRQKRTPGLSRFPAWFVPGLEPEECRSAWCYGDPGVAAALLLAARCVGEPDWEREALDIALGAAARAPDATGAKDPAICHGAAGLGHVFNRLFQATGREELRRAAVTWLEKTLAMRQPGTGLAGFSSVGQDASGNQAPWPDPGLLSGAAGVALALLAAATDVPPDWDRTLLVSVAPGRAIRARAAPARRDANDPFRRAVRRISRS